MLLNVERAREHLRREGLDAVVLSTPLNVVYAGDFASEFLLGRFEDNTAAVVLAADPKVPAALVVAEFDLPFLVERPSWIEDVQLYGNPWSSVGTFMGETLERNLSNELRRNLAARRRALRPRQAEDFFAGLAATLRARGLERARLSVDDLRVGARLQAMGFGGSACIADALQLMRRVRMVKTPAERALMTRGAEINVAALDAVIAAGRTGMAEDDLTAVYRMSLTRHNARWLGERGMMFGAGDASSFSLPASRERTLAPGDAVVLDCLGTYQGYHIDLARTSVVGAPTKEQTLRYKAVITALEAVEAAIKPGVHTQDLRKLTRDTVVGFGLRAELVSVTTHGLGLEVFEFPYEDSLRNGFALEQGMIVNTEVFYRDPDLGSFHLEDSVAVEAQGCALLAPMKRDMIAFA
ncbi:MAG: aminopeptidase P family protein [Alphaproteobacteria bacterium]|nr:aminopeptidase P family protein [Alphaproteobacteria bacterium]